MAYQEFDGELDAPKYTEFTGELDAKPTKGLLDSANEALDSALTLLPDGIENRINTLRGRGKRESVLEGQTMTDPSFDAAEAQRLSRKSYVDQQATKQAQRNSPSMREDDGTSLPASDRGVLGRAADMAESQARQATAGAAQFGSDVLDAVGADDTARALQTSARGNQQAAKNIDAGNQLRNVANEADASMGGLEKFSEKYAPQVLAQLPQIGLTMISGGVTLPAVLSGLGSYADAREQGTSPLEALPYAAAMGGMEAIGEKLGGMGKLADAFEDALTKGFTKDAAVALGKQAMQSGLREVPSEEITYAGQVGVGNIAGVNPVNDFGSFAEGAKDTAIVAAGAGGVLGGAGAIASHLAAPKNNQDLVARELARALEGGTFAPSSIDLANPNPNLSNVNPALEERRIVAQAAIPTASTQDEAVAAFIAATDSSVADTPEIAAALDSVSPKPFANPVPLATDLLARTEADLATQELNNGTAATALPGSTDGAGQVLADAGAGVGDAGGVGLQPGVPASLPDNALLDQSGGVPGGAPATTLTSPVSNGRSPSLARAPDSYAASGTFPTVDAAQAHVDNQGLAGQVSLLNTPNGVVIAPKAIPTTAADDLNDDQAIASLNRGIAASGETPNVTRYTPKPTDDANVRTVAAAIRTLGVIVNTAFASRLIPVQGANGYGVTYGGRVFVDVGMVASGRDTGLSLANLVIHLAGHEVDHQLEKSKNPQDRADHAAFAAVVAQYRVPGALEARTKSEDEISKKFGGQALGTQYAANEIVADVNGAMWRDHKFWGRLYDLDNGSTMRRIAYKFMQAMTKVISVAKGVDNYDVSNLVTNLDAVREAAAQAWASKASRSGKPQSRSSINAMLSDPPVYNRQSNFEVAPDPNDKELSGLWNALPLARKQSISRTVADEVVPKVLAQRGYKGTVAEQYGSYLDDTNPSFALMLDDGDLHQVSKDLGHVLSQDSMMNISGEAFPGGEKVGAVVVDLGGKSFDEVKAIYDTLRKSVPEVGGQSFAKGRMVVLNYSDTTTEELAKKIDSALESKYPVDTQDYYSSFPEKAEYGHDDHAEDTGARSGTESPVRQGYDGLRRQASDAIRRELTQGRPDSVGTAGDRAQVPGAVHYSKAAGLSTLVGTNSGTGIKGAEQERLSQPGTDPRIKKRVYFYLPVEGGIPKPEMGLGANVYTADLKDLYDASTTKTPIRGMGNALESAILDAGYTGYINRAQGTVVVLNQNVAVKSLGKSGEQTQVQRKTEDVKPKNMTRAEKDELVRRPLNSEVLQIIRAGKALKLVAPSFKMEYGEARVHKDEAAHADLALADAGSEFQFGTPSYNRRFQSVDDFDAASTDDIDELGAFNMDTNTEDDIDAAGDVMEAGGSFEDFLATRTTAAKAKLQAELDAEMRAPKTPKAVTLEDMKAHGLHPEMAFDEALGEAAEAEGGIRFANDDGGRVLGQSYSIRPDSGAWYVRAPGTWSIKNMDREAAIKFAKHMVVARKIQDSGFDIASGYRKGTVLKMVETWRKLAGKPGMFKLPESGKSKDFASIAKEMKAFPGYTVSAMGNINNLHVNLLREDGAVYSANLSGFESSLEACTMGLAGSGDLGSKFYAVAGEYARLNERNFLAADTLSSINTARRTEQALSYALKTGNAGVLLPGIQNRVYGFKKNPRTLEDHALNTGRLLLASLRNAVEVDPNIRRLRYDPATDAFTDAKGRDASAKVKAFLELPEARAYGMGRTTLARAVVTSQIVSGTLDADKVAEFKEPIAYSRKIGMEPLSEQWGEEGAVAPNLKRYLGDSVMVHKDGTPVVMFHGTAQNIEAFKPKQAGAIFLSFNPNFAEDFANASAEWMQRHFDQVLTPEQVAQAKANAVKTVMGEKLTKLAYRKEMAEAIMSDKPTGEALDAMMEAAKTMMPSGENILPLVVRAENPFDFRKQQQVDELLEQIDGNGRSGIGATIAAAYDGKDGYSFNGDAVVFTYGDIERFIKEGSWTFIEKPEVQQALHDLGHDSFYVMENGQLNLAVYNPNQVKSAVGNNGNYDLADDRIAYSRKDEVPSRFPKGKKFVGDKTSGALYADYASAKADASYFNKIVTLASSFTGLRGDGTEATAELNVEFFKRNLLALYDHAMEVSPEAFEMATHWYVGGHKLATDFGTAWGKPTSAGSGVIAVLSPSMDWFMNIEVARRLGDVLTNRRNTRWSDAMQGVANGYRSNGDAAMVSLLDAVEGKTLGALRGNDEKAIWFDLYDRAHHDTSYRSITPDGEFLGNVQTKAGADAGGLRQSLANLAKAVSIYEDPSKENISLMLGSGHKVRNFYNNIANPNSTNNYTTIDTHAVGAAHLLAISNKSPIVNANFSGPASANTGLKGTYPLYHEAYVRAAQERNILPRAMQSITWEAVRTLFENKRAVADRVSQIWDNHQQGGINEQQAREQVFALTGGVKAPDWFRPGMRGAQPSGTGSQSQELDGNRASGENSASTGRGAVGGDSRGTVAYARRAGPVEFKYQNNYLVPEIEGAFADGNIAQMPAIVFARDGINRTFTAMPVRMRVGEHQNSDTDPIVKQYGLQHRIGNKNKDPQYRAYATPKLEGGSEAEVERAAREITLGVLDAQTAYADNSPTKVYLHAPSLNRYTVLETQTDANGEKFWSVVTSMPSTREQMMRRYKAPTSVVGISLNRERTQQAVDIKRGILEKLKEPGQSPVTSESYIIDDQGLLFKGESTTKVDEAPAVAPKQLARDANGKIILNKNKEAPVFSRKQTEEPKFKAWFKDSKVVDAQGKPLVVYRGEHGKTKDGELQTKIGNYTFTNDPSAASAYASQPNDYSMGDFAEQPRVVPTYISIKNPIVNSKDNPFINFGDISKKLGSPAFAKHLALKYADEIEDTLGWDQLEASSVKSFLHFNPDGLGRLRIVAYHLLDDMEFTSFAQENGFDGAINQGTGVSEEAVEYRVFNKTQIKSVFNNGNWDGTDGRISYSRALQGQNFTLPSETKTSQARRILQDFFLPVLEVQKALVAQGGVVGEAQDVYRAEERSHGRVEEAIKDFERKVFVPLVEKASDKATGEINMDELALYAYAKHAPERNAHIASIDKRLQDGGSGMTNREAADIIAAFTAEGKLAKLEDLHNDLMAITATTRRTLLEEGLITQASYDAMEAQYENYIPLRGFAEMDEDDKPSPKGRGGKGFNVRGEETMRALGRTSLAGDLIENVVADYEKAVVRGERNTVAKVFLDMVLTNPDPGLWEIDAEKTRKSFDKAAGRVARNTTIDTGEDTIAVKVDGKEVYIKVYDQRFLRAMKFSFKDDTGAVTSFLMNTVGIYSTLMRNTLTRFNPAFAGVNAVRDFGMGSVAMVDALGFKGQAKFTKNYAGALAASFRNEVDAMSGASAEWQKWFEEYRAAGSTTGGYYARSVDDIKGDIRDIMLLNGAAPKGKLEYLKASKGYGVMKKAGHLLEMLGSTSENAARLAAYRTAREMGKTPAEAASIAKNLTTNFNRKGEWGQAINTLFVFYNAAVQGSHRTLVALSNPKVQGLMAGAAAAGFMMALANAANGGDDDDGQAYWDKIADFEKERNFIIMLPPGIKMDGVEKVGKHGRYLKIPMPYGFNIFPMLGQQMADVYRHSKDETRGIGPGKATLNMANAVLGSFNPFGGAIDPASATSVGMAVAPSIGDLFIQMGAGVNAFDRPTAPYKSEMDTRLDSENVNPRQAGGWAHQMARGLNKVTGGNQVEAGAIDVNPGTLENLWRNATGGTGVFLTDVFANIPMKALTPESDLTAKDIPLLRNFYGSVDETNNASLFYERRKAINDAAATQKRYDHADMERPADKDFEALVDLSRSAARYTKQLSKMRKEEIEIALDEKATRAEKAARTKDLKRERDETITEFNTEFMEVMRGKRDGEYGK